ncbi:MAG: Holliday junction branch migration protein RuvA [Bacteroidetes bacterium]|nr:MAG: Holliday junction branch migration protein RuvA [Bacteroidota bacterium]
MITYLHGTLTRKTPTEITVEVHGVGYAVHISLSTYEQLPEPDSTVKVLTYHHIREDVQALYGFMRENEREMFLMLIGVSGIGPRMAQTILSGIRTEELVRTITHSALSTLTAIPGVGRKTAERLILELKDRVAKMEGAEKIIDLPTAPSALRGEALNALLSLGFTRDKAEQTLRAVLYDANGSALSLEELIKKALQHSSR